MAGETILHIGYDSVLLELRDSVLRRGDYQVISSLGNASARQAGQTVRADIAVIGSGGTYSERLEMAVWLRKNLPGIPVIAMAVSPDEEFPDGVVLFYGRTPEDWLIAIERVLRGESQQSQR